MQELRIAHSAHGPANSPTLMALRLGYFAKAGLQVTPVASRNTSESINCLRDGDADVAVGPGVPVLLAAMSGLDPVVILSAASVNLFGVIAARRVREPADLTGGVVCCTALRDQGHVVLHRCLHEWAIDPETDVTMRVLGNRRKQWDAVVAGEVDVFAATVPQPILARKAGLPVLRDFAPERIPYQLGCVVSTRRFAERRPDLLRRLVDGLLIAYRAFEDDPDLTLPFLSAASQVDDPEVLAETHRLLVPEFRDYIPRVLPLANVARDLELTLGRPLGVDIASLVDTGFVP